MATNGRMSSYRPSNPIRWLPEFLQLGRTRVEAQGRLLGAAVLVGIIAGLGAVLFSIACDVVVHYAQQGIIGYRVTNPPRHEAHIAEERFPENYVDNWFDGWMGVRPWENFTAWMRQLTGLQFGEEFYPWLLLIVPAVGGLISGFLVFYFAPEAEGHGTDAAIAAYHYKQGYIRPRVPLIKILASAITIGTGGSGGREGPIAQIGAGFGSVLGRLLKMRPAEKRILMAAGVGAGIAAIFRAPLAGALFASEVLYRSPEFEAEVLIPTGMASVVAYCTFGMAFGFEPLFEVRVEAFHDPAQLILYFALAILMAILAMMYTRTFYFVTYLFHRLPISNYFKPAVGAFLSGAVGLAMYMGWQAIYGQNEPSLLSVLSFGYGILQHGFDSLGKLPPAESQSLMIILVAVALGKILTTSLTIGSGGSGGVFGPSIVIGGCGGAAVGLFCNQIWPELVPQPQAFMLVGMAGFFAAAGKVPLSTLLMVCELTNNYNLLLPALWVCAFSYLLSDEQSIYESQVESRSLSPAHKGEYVRDVLTGLRVSQFLKPDSANMVIHPQDDLGTVVDRLSDSTYSVLPVVDETTKLLGVVVLEEVYQASQSPHMSPWILAADLMRAPIKPLKPEYTLDHAQELFVRNDLFALPVVDDDNKVLGIVKRSDIGRIYLKHVHGTATEEASTMF